VIRFHALGALTVTDDGEELGIGGPRQRRLLAMLLIHRGQVVSVDRLADAVFAGAPTAAASTTLRSYVARARRILGHSDGTELVTRAPGYLLRTPDDAFDVTCFEHGMAHGTSLLGHDAPAAAQVLRRALDLWRGDAYAEFLDEDWARPEADRLGELRLVAHERLVEAELASGRASAAIPEVEALTRAHPLREEFRAQLMLALYRTGRHADALRVFRDYRALLVEELGVDPSPALAAIEQRVLTHDPGLLLTEPDGRPLRGYRLGERLGTGRDGTVYAARVPGVERELAVRVVRAEVADRPEFVRSFETRAQQLATLRHPGIVPIHDYWREPGAAYVVMRRLTGGTLADRLVEGPLTEDALADLVSRVGGALAVAADLGIAHGRVAPENVLFDAAGHPCLTDFALATDDASTSTTDDVSDFAALVGACLARPDGRLAHLVARGAGSVDRPAMADLVTLFLAELTGEHTDPSVERSNPYKGLRAFEESDAGDFFGRAELVEQVLDRLRGSGLRSRLVLVVGGSGSGKSSIVRAGLLPAVRRGEVPGSDRWFVSTMMPGSAPFKELAESLRRVAVTAPEALADRLAADAGGIDGELRRLVPGDAQLLVVVDQLEELFTLAAPPDQRAFLAGLMNAVSAADSRLRVVATLRADFFDRPLAHQPFGTVVQDATVTVSAMLPADLEAAIVEPAERAGRQVERALVAELVSAVADEPAALPSLQYTLYELAERSPTRCLDLAGYRELGGVGGAIASRAERLWASLDDAERDVVRRVFERLVVLSADGEPTRRRAARTELDALGDGRAVEAVVDGWAQARLLTLDRDPRTRVPTVEIAHEALLRAWPRLSAWVEEDREAIVAHDRLREATATWLDLGRDPGALYQGARLEVVLDDPLLRPEDLPAPEREFLAASAEAQNRARHEEAEEVARRISDNRRLRVQRAMIAVALVVALAGGFIALDQRAQADAERRVATARGLAAAAVSNIPADPERAVLLALAAVEETRSEGEPVLPEAVEALHGAVAETRVLLRVPDVGGGLDWSPAGDVFVTEGPEESGIVDIRDATTGESRLAFQGHGDDINHVAFSEDGSVLATTGDDGALRLWEPETGRPLGVVTGPGTRRQVREVDNVSVWSPSFSPDGTRVAASWSEGVRVADVRTGRTVVDLPAVEMSGTAFSPDGAMIAYGKEHAVVVADAGTGDTLFRLRSGGGLDLGWSPDGRWLATTGFDGIAQVWDGRTGDYLYPVTGHRGQIWSLDWSPRGHLLVTGGDDGTARIHQITAWGALPVHSFAAQETNRGGAFIGVSFSPDGRRLMGGDLGVGSVTIWDADPLGGGEWTGTVGPGVLTPDGSRLLVAGRRGRLILLDSQTGARLDMIRADLGPRRKVWDLELDHQGERVALVASTGVVVVDVASGRREFVVPWPRRSWGLGGLAWSRDDERLAIGFGSDNPRRALVVVDENGEDARWFPEEPGWATRSISFSSDGQLLATTHWGVDTVDPTQMPVRTWDLRSGELAHELDAQAKLVAFAPAGDLLATSRAVEGVAEIWDSGTRERVAVLTATANVEDLSFDSTGTTLATAHSDGTVRLWDARAGTQDLVLQVSDRVVEWVRFSHDGSTLVTRDRDGVTRVWALDLDDLIGLARERLTRDFTDAECREYLGLASCPDA
jgi:WD40 repeat protein/DNA-binding SARP family transcriptional activator